MAYDVIIVPSGGTLQWVSGQTVTMKQIDSGVELSNYNTGQTTRFSVDGANGQIFTIVDDLSDSLMSVNNISGLPILEVFATNKVVMGTYATNALVVSGTSIGMGTQYPGQKLVISGGTIQIVSGNQGAGKILTSDANGVASWQSGTTGTSGTSGTNGTSGTSGSSGSSGSSGINGFSTDTVFYYNDTIDRLYVPNLTISSTGFTFSGLTSSGYVLTSDSNGVASWQSISVISGITGSGTIGYIPRFTGTTILGNSQIRDDGSSVGINVAPYSDGQLKVNSTKIYSGMFYSNKTDGTTYGLLVSAGGSNTGRNTAGYFTAANGTENYAIYVEYNLPPTGATNFSFYSASLANSYFAGGLGIGSTPTAAKLVVSNDSGSNQGTMVIDQNHASAEIVDFRKSGSSKVRILNSGQIYSSVATGTSPLSVTSTTLNTNLNADLLDGYHSSDFVLSSNTFWSGSTGGNIWTLNSGNVGIGNTGATEKLDVVGNIDFNTYQAIAMSCHSGTTLPTSPTPRIGQWFLHNTTGRKILMQYNGDIWQSIISLSALTFYVNNTTGGDFQNSGTSTANPFDTIQYAIDQIPPLNAGNVIINVAAGTYSETLIIQGKAYTGNYSITIQGDTFIILSGGTLTSFTAGASSSTQPTPASILHTGAGFSTNALVGKFINFNSGSTYYPILSNTTDTVVFADNSLTSVSGTYTISTGSTKLTNNGINVMLTLQSGQLAINFNNFIFSNTTTAGASTARSTIVNNQYTQLTMNYCHLQGGPLTSGMNFGIYSRTIFNNSYVWSATQNCLAVVGGSFVGSATVINAQSSNSACIRETNNGISSASNICCLMGSNQGQSGINLIASTSVIFNFYFYNLSVGVSADDASYYAFQNPLFSTFVNCTIDIVKPLQLRNSNLQFLTGGTIKFTSGYNATNDYVYFNYGTSGVITGITNKNIAIDNAGNVTFDHKIGIGYPTGTTITTGTTYLDVQNSASTVFFSVVADNSANASIVSSGVSGGAAFTMTDWGSSMKTQWNFKAVANTGQFKIRDMVGGQDMAVFEQSGGTNTIYIKRMNALGAQPALGYVGIGTNNPTALFTISGQTSGDTLLQVSNQLGYDFLRINQSSMSVNAAQRNDFVFSVAGSSDLNLLYTESNNNTVGINTKVPRGKLDVNSVGSSDGPALFLQKTNRTSDPFISFSGATSGSTAYNISTANTANTPTGPGSGAGGWAFAQQMIKINVNGADRWIPLYNAV